MSETLRADLEPLPERLQKLPVHRGYPVPWFVALVDGEPEFRCMDAAKWPRAVNEKLCWVCGERLGKYMTFVAGPMCGLNCVSSEPPCHLECAQWSARNCPFLSKPQMERRETPLPEGAREGPGVQLLRNPGVTLLWITKDYALFDDGAGRPLIQMGTPVRVEWWALGKLATRNQVQAAVEAGMPSLIELADGPQALEDLARRKRDLEYLYPRRPQEVFDHA